MTKTPVVAVVALAICQACSEGLDLSQIEGTYDLSLREKINAASRQFKDLKGQVCTIVIANPQGASVYLDEMAVIGAMCGDLGWISEMNPNERAFSDFRPGFLAGGKMTQRDPAKVFHEQNTRISAIAILEKFPLGSRRFDVWRAEEQRKTGKRMDPIELLESFDSKKGTPEDLTLKRLRLVVYDNPVATAPLPLEFGRGPFDERFAKKDRRFKRLFAGQAVLDIETKEKEVGIMRDDPLGLRSYTEQTLYSSRQGENKVGNSEQDHQDHHGRDSPRFVIEWCSRMAHHQSL
ncbi:MAG: hypothetical protein HY851_04495 [candidate division Zixibacteria bacterium]|nr:hypothetical protein [candidate division Zixibacteria bacterium]